MSEHDSQQIVNKAWSYAHVLRDDGLSYMAYTEQITFLLFLKMSHEQTQPPYNRKPIVPAKYGWESLLSRDGAELEAHYRTVLLERLVLHAAFCTVNSGSVRSKTRVRTKSHPPCKVF